MTVNKRQYGFTILELLLAMGLLGIIIISSGLVFRKAVESYRVAKATSEISQKLEALTSQIEKDFAGLRKDGEIFLLWQPNNPVDTDSDGIYDTYDRFDRAMFYTTGDFVSYNNQETTTSGVYKQVNGNLARVCYSFARDENNVLPEVQEAKNRMLIRSQHIYTSDSDLPGFDTLGVVSSGLTEEEDFRDNYFSYEYDTRTMDEWMNIPFSDGSGSIGGKATMLSIITGTGVGPSNLDQAEWSAKLDSSNPEDIYMLLCEGVGSFEIQGWSDTVGRWVPMYDPDGDGDYTDDSDFYLSGSNIDITDVIGNLYPYIKFSNGSFMGNAKFGSTSELYDYPKENINEAHFNDIPGFGRAFKFTFTLYDSMGVFKDGKTFTHIVYLDK